MLKTEYLNKIDRNAKTKVTWWTEVCKVAHRTKSVSYTHLDVYKRQAVCK